MHVNLVQQMTRVDKNDWYNNTYRNCEYNHDIDLNCFCKRKSMQRNMCTFNISNQ